jgi:hypothetical protein
LIYKFKFDLTRQSNLVAPKNAKFGQIRPKDTLKCHYWSKMSPKRPVFNDHVMILTTIFSQIRGQINSNLIQKFEFDF